MYPCLDIAVEAKSMGSTGTKISCLVSITTAILGSETDPKAFFPRYSLNIRGVERCQSPEETAPTRDLCEEVHKAPDTSAILPNTMSVKAANKQV